MSLLQMLLPRHRFTAHHDFHLPLSVIMMTPWPDYSPYTVDWNLAVLASASQVNPVLYCQEIGNSGHCQHCCCPKSNTIAEVLDQCSKQHGARSNAGIKGQKDCTERGSPAPGINSFQDICGKCWISRSKSSAKNDR